MTAAFFPAVPDGCFFGAAARSAAVLRAGRLASNLPFFLIRIPPIQKPQGDIICFVTVLYIKRPLFATAFPTGTGSGILKFLLTFSGLCSEPPVKPPLVMPRMIRGGGIFKENDGGDFLLISECSEICDIRIPSGASRQLPLSPRGALGGSFTSPPSGRAGQRRHRRAGSRASGGPRLF